MIEFLGGLFALLVWAFGSYLLVKLIGFLWNKNTFTKVLCFPVGVFTAFWFWQFLMGTLEVMSLATKI
jgi:hypothetical protein